MANVDRPSGFKPFGDLMHVGIYVAAGTIYPGDMVKAEGGTAANTARMRMQVEAATAGAACLGVALNYAVAGQEVRVADDPSQLFVAQADDGDFDVNADLGLNASILATAGNTTYKMSRMEIDSSTLATTATLELKILGVLGRTKNEYGTNTVLICKINNSQLGSHTGTAGV